MGADVYVLDIDSLPLAVPDTAPCLHPGVAVGRGSVHRWGLLVEDTPGYTP